MNNLLSAVAVVVPIYKETLDNEELISIRTCNRILADYDRFFVAPRGINVTYYKSLFPDFNFTFFDDSYFVDVNSYNELMLSPYFYKEYKDYEYILIHQTDAIVFRDELMEFVRKGYDYIGAPWVEGKGIWVPYSYKSDLFSRVVNKIYSILNCNKFVRVGNGGLSLRNVKKCVDVTQREDISFQATNANEDVVFAWYGKRHPRCFRVASIEDALKFSFDKNPELCYEMAGKRIPFGCHAWYRYDRAFLEKWILNESDD